MFRFFVCLILATAAMFITRTGADANSYGSYGGYVGAPLRAVARVGTAPVRAVGAVLANGVERRQARRADRRASRGWGCAGRTSYGSAGQTSYGSHGSTSYATPVVAVDYCPAESEPLTIEMDVQLCPTGDCPRRFPLLGGNRRNPIFN